MNGKLSIIDLNPLANFFSRFRKRENLIWPDHFRLDRHRHPLNLRIALRIVKWGIAFIKINGFTNHPMHWAIRVSWG